MRTNYWGVRLLKIRSTDFFCSKVVKIATLPEQYKKKVTSGPCYYGNHSLNMYSCFIQVFISRVLCTVLLCSTNHTLKRATNFLQALSVHFHTKYWYTVVTSSRSVRIFRAKTQYIIHFSVGIHKRTFFKTGIIHFLKFKIYIFLLEGYRYRIHSDLGWFWNVHFLQECTTLLYLEVYILQLECRSMSNPCQRHSCRCKYLNSDVSTQERLSFF